MGGHCELNSEERADTAYPVVTVLLPHHIRQPTAQPERLVNAASLPPDVEIAAGWDACMTSIARPAALAKIERLFERGFGKPGDAETRLGFYVGQPGR